MKRVLIADDSQFMRLSIKQILTKHNYEVVGQAENGKIALEKYKELFPDLVTLDITMNEMNGVEALEKIMEYDPDAKVVMVSAIGQDMVIKKAFAIGAKGFLIKPLNEEQVIATLSKLFE